MQLPASILKRLFFIDIETASGVEHFDHLSPNLQRLWKHRSRRYPWHDPDRADELYAEKAGLFAEFGRIIVVGMGLFYQLANNQFKFKAQALAGPDEHSLLKSFSEIINKAAERGNIIMVGHNAREFDVPYLARRMLVNNLPLPKVIKDLEGMKPWQNPVQDTMQLWKFGDIKNFTSLELLAEIMGLPNPKTDLDGSKVNHAYYKEKRLPDIANYCTNDVVTTARLYLRMKSQDTLPDDIIERQAVRYFGQPPATNSNTEP